MSQNGSWDRRNQPRATSDGKGDNFINPTSFASLSDSRKLCASPKTDHKPESYDDLQLEFSPLLFSSLEQYLPPHMLNAPRDAKVQYMKNILFRYLPESERTRIQRHKEYKQKIILNYPPLHKEIYTMHAENFFTPSFLKAIRDNTEESFRSVIAEPSAGIYTFEMLQPQFCEMLVSEVDHFERWVHETKFRIMRPNTMNRYGAVLDDLGMETMLDKLMNDYIIPLARVFFARVGGSSLDSHHGFVVEYGMHRDVELGFHVDDSEVTLNICLGKQFSGGELFFRGVRCDEHVNTETQPEEIYDYCHVPGRAVFHNGRHRHGARATTSGQRINLIIWCRSSIFREMKKYLKDFSSWCGECRRKKKERERLSIAATKQKRRENEKGSKRTNGRERERKKRREREGVRLGSRSLCDRCELGYTIGPGEGSSGGRGKEQS
ncbi:2-oxoglutarate and iron-dependent oxygenase domain-containing protein CP2-like isoform X3 [Prosopis cineraria]|uniref:2-oxoglutarate and iron-dependent oxygenase domain-containing protein CP2-like isoform X3 n=1 Tax=Prosopis cineraria TaxID=364024 RepID=UPI00240F6C1E|nr:2-oxoglutarate and iron-dependent oxygenase domain-containing protein CP2-like isoform X3 [Prosopis cineraria]